MSKVVLTSKGHETRLCFFPLLFVLFTWFLPTWSVSKDSGHCGGFTSSDFPCAFRPTGNDRTWQLRPAVWFNQLSVSLFYIDSCSWPVKVNKRTLIQTSDTDVGKKISCPHFNSSLVCSILTLLETDGCLTLNKEIKPYWFISTWTRDYGLVNHRQRLNHSLQTSIKY